LKILVEHALQFLNSSVHYLLPYHFAFALGFWVAVEDMDSGSESLSPQMQCSGHLYKEKDSG